MAGKDWSYSFTEPGLQSPLAWESSKKQAKSMAYADCRDPSMTFEMFSVQ